MADQPPAPVPTARALFRYRVLSEVLVTEVRGVVRREAVRQVADRVHLGPDGAPRKVGLRSVYRWLALYRERGLLGLEDAPRSPLTTDGALDPALVSFLVAAKEEDPRASIPQLLNEAVVVGLLTARIDVDRTTVWRHLKRRGVDTRRKRHVRDQRRFEMAHRLQLVLCDGKRFRAGPSLAKRVALFFIDDASRYIPTVVVGTDETAELFLRGLYLFLCQVGCFDAVYLDNGSGFSALDTAAVFANLGIGHILGTAGYPPGRGKIERFNQTVEEHLLRHLTHPSVDPDFTALELRIAPFLRQDYNQWNHEGLGGKTSPLQRFLADDRPLHPYDAAELRRYFFVTEERTVSNDHVVKLEGAQWEVPRGLAQQRITIRRDVLEPGRYFLEHEGAWQKLERVRLYENARERRGRVPSEAPEPTTTKGAALTKADSALAPITQPDGGFAATDEESPR